MCELIVEVQALDYLPRAPVSEGYLPGAPINEGCLPRAPVNEGQITRAPVNGRDGRSNSQTELQGSLRSPTLTRVPIMSVELTPGATTGCVNVGAFCAISSYFRSKTTQDERWHA